MRLLLVAGESGDANLIREALLEIEESRRWRAWVRHIKVVEVAQLDEALAVAAAEPFDAAVVDTPLPDATGPDALLALRRQLPALPVILLVPENDDPLALSAVREGAEDCIMKSELDCSVLARGLRYTIERRRRTAALESLTLLDPETGLFNRAAFLKLGERDRRLARQIQRPTSMVVVDITDSDPLLAAEVSDLIRLSFGETDLLARLDAQTFAVLSIGGQSTETSQALAALQHRVNQRNQTQSDGRSLNIRVGITVHGPAQDWTVPELLDLARSSVCENRPSEPALENRARRASA